MVDILHRESAREEYFYQLGRLEVLEHFADERDVRPQIAVVRNAKEQVIQDTPEWEDDALFQGYPV